LTLIPLIKKATALPLIAAGGIASGRSMLAAMALGAEGVQIGSRFVASEESSAHPAFKQKILETGDGGTFQALKKVVPVRLIRNSFFQKVHQLEDSGASAEELKELLGRGRSKLGMFDGNVEEGELEIGQVAGLINHIQPAGEIISEIISDFETARKELLEYRISNIEY
jgi:enoyl-[acyl-carrier protein] reductase II